MYARSLLLVLLTVAVRVEQCRQCFLLRIIQPRYCKNVSPFLLSVSVRITAKELVTAISLAPAILALIRTSLDEAVD